MSKRVLNSSAENAHSAHISSPARSAFRAWRGVVLAVALTVGAFGVGCDSGPKPGEEAAYYGQRIIDEKDDVKRSLAIKEISKISNDKKDFKAALPGLLAAIKSPTGDYKREAVELIGKSGDASAVAALVDAIDWKATSGRAASLNEAITIAIGKLAKPGDAKAVDALKRVAANGHLEAQLQAVIALGNLKATDAVSDLIDIVRGHENNFMVKNAVQALGEIGDAKAVPALGRALFFERTGVSFYVEASYSLFQIGKDSVPTLMDIWNNKFQPIEDLHVDTGVQRYKALETLVDLGNTPELNKMVVQAVNTKLTGTGDALLITLGQKAAGRLGITEAAPAMLKQWQDVDVSLSEHALGGLTQMGNRSIVGQLAKITDHKGFMAQCTARFSEGACKNDAAKVRKPRILAWSRLSDGSDLEAFEKMIAAEPDADMKKYMEEQKPRIVAAKECKKELACFLGKLKDANAQVREKAGYEILWSKDAAALQQGYALLGDDDNEARYAGILMAWRNLPKDQLDNVKKIYAEGRGKTQYVRLNEDYRRLIAKLERGY